jgi:hypothetical protein
MPKIEGLNQDDIERLARVAWANTGKGELPVLPPGHGWVDGVTRKPIPEEDLISTWGKVGTKDIFRRQAAAVVQALGFELGENVTVKPRGLVKASAFRIEQGDITLTDLGVIVKDRGYVAWEDFYQILELLPSEANKRLGWFSIAAPPSACSQASDEAKKIVQGLLKKAPKKGSDA